MIDTMLKVTYLLGAGASANALPIVSNFMERLDSYRFRFMRFQEFAMQESEFQKITDLKTAYDFFTNTISSLIDQVPRGTSIDTFAKRALLINDKNQLRAIKAIIAGFLTIEHFVDVNRLKQNYQLSPIDLPKVPYGCLNLDKRYYQFWAALAKRKDNELLFPQNIRMISWNYDFQPELSLIEFLFPNFKKNGLEEIHWNEARKKLNFLPPSESSNTGFSFSKLNGTAELIVAKKEEYPLEKIFKNQIIGYKDIIDIIMRTYFAGDPDDHSVETHIHFAWEHDLEKSPLIHNTIERIRDTDVLVIIGYSFPFFNRDVDQYLITSMKELKKVYVQIPDREGNLEASTRLDAILEKIRSQRRKGKIKSTIELEVKSIYSENEFYLPSELTLDY